jgi:hypothetical protein
VRFCHSERDSSAPARASHACGGQAIAARRRATSALAALAPAALRGATSTTTRDCDAGPRRLGAGIVRQRYAGGMPVAFGQPMLAWPSALFVPRRAATHAVR